MLSGGIGVWYLAGFTDIAVTKHAIQNTQHTMNSSLRNSSLMIHDGTVLQFKPDRRQ
jgi:hypothetical protein